MADEQEWEWVRLRHGQGDSSRWIRVKKQPVDEEEE